MHTSHNLIFHIFNPAFLPVVIIITWKQSPLKIRIFVKIWVNPRSLPTPYFEKFHRTKKFHLRSSKCGSDIPLLCSQVTGGLPGAMRPAGQLPQSVATWSTSPFRKLACNTHFSDEFLDFSKTTPRFSSLDTLGDAPWSTLSLSSLHL